jgi:hypothetical protein
VGYRGWVGGGRGFMAHLREVQRVEGLALFRQKGRGVFFFSKEEKND